MKGVLVLIDGLGDLPNKILGEKTPLEAAYTPNMDFLVTRGEIGIFYPVKEDYVPESDEALLSIFGNNHHAGARGPLEAIGEELQFVRGDLALRANFATIDSLEGGNILDRRAGRTLSIGEVEELAKAISKIKLQYPFMFKPTIQHKAVVVFKGGFSESVLGNDVTYIQGKALRGNRVKRAISLDEEDNSHFTANVLNEFIRKSHLVLREHPINKRRISRGLLPANYLLLRSPGVEVPKLKQYRNWKAFAYMPLEKGFARSSGMKLHSFDYPKLKGVDSYENLWKGLRKACKLAIKFVKKNRGRCDYAYIHLSEPDFASHDNKPIEKKQMIEHIDRTLFDFLRKFAPPNKLFVAVTGNNSTPCYLKDHSADPLPVFVFNGSIPREKNFSEREARNGGLGKFIGKDLLKKIGFE